MLDHPTADLVEHYRSGQLPPDRLLEVDDHLVGCEACRALLATNLQHRAEAWSGALAMPDATRHVTYQQLALHVDGGLDDTERESVDAHLAACPTCAAELGDLRRFTATLAPAPRPPERLSARDRIRRALGRLWKVPATRVAIAAIAAVAIWALIPHRLPIAMRPGLSVGGPLTIGLPGRAIAVRDGDRTITLGPDGRLVGLDQLTADEQARVARALTSGRLEVRAPGAPPSMAAEVLASRVEEVRRRSAGSHLALSIAYADAGMIDAAAEELRALERDNPSSPAIAALVESLHARR